MMTREAALTELRMLGCSNHGCAVWPPTGMATNGPCHCLDGMDPNDRVKVRRALSIMRALVKSDAPV